MSNLLVGDLYEKVIESVVEKSRTAFEEFGVPGLTLDDLQQGWQMKLSARGTAVMPWDPKPVQQPPQPAPAPPSAVANGMNPSSSSNYDTPPSAAAANQPRIKQEPGLDAQYSGLPNGFAQNGAQPQGGAARAAQLMQQQYGSAASASVNAMQRGSGLALPGQQQSKPQLHLPAHSPPQNQQQFSPQQQQAIRQQQMQYQQQQGQPRVKMESDSPHLAQSAFPQQPAQPNYSQTDGADEAEALDQWRTMLAQRRAMHAEHGEQADHLMRDAIQQHSAELQSGLMMPLDELPSNKRLKRTVNSSSYSQPSSGSSVPQLDGVIDGEDEEKPDIKEEDSDAINSELDDSDGETGDALGDDEDVEMDTILCTYDKVQRVKNKWKCTLKDGIMSAEGKEWIFAKGMGEFEW